MSVWSTIEAGAGIIAGCMATLRPLVKHLFKEIHLIQSPVSEPIVNSSYLTEVNSASVEETGGKDKQWRISRTCDDHRLGFGVQHYEHARDTLSYGTGRGSEEHILSQEADCNVNMQETKSRPYGKV